MYFVQKIKKNFRKLGLPDPEKISGKPFMFYYKETSISSELLAIGGNIENIKYVQSGENFFISIHFTHRDGYDKKNSKIEYYSGTKKYQMFPERCYGNLEIGV